jgi:hypothetical protein
MLGFKSFWSAAVTLAGVELMHMIRKGQLLLRGGCVRRSSSIHWQNKIIWPLGLRSSIRNICDRTPADASAFLGMPELSILALMRLRLEKPGACNHNRSIQPVEQRKPTANGPDARERG